jgi:hypothetical protein
MQFDLDASGKMTPLPKPSVDTGAGLERIAAILQGVNNNFDTDLFRPIIAEIERLSGRPYVGGMAVADAPFRVIADHARAATMLMSDGVLPSNEGRGYVLRRIIRRALRYARQLGIDKPILYELAPVVLGLFRGIHVAEAGGAAARGVGATAARGGTLRQDALQRYRPDRRGDRTPAALGQARCPDPPSSGSMTRTASPSTSSRRSQATRGFRSIAAV